jgi:type II secretory ATPase GspE/PulE/Tfp pilus assembly ATPase PilB-like protein
MITGNMVLNGKPTEDDLEHGICSQCKEECNEQVIDASFSDSFGWVEDWESNGSQCCGATIFQGKIYLHQVTFHKARKDHKDGLILKGDHYRKEVKKGYYIEDGVHKGIVEYSTTNRSR